MLRHKLFDAISENRWRWRDPTRAKALFGWQPTGRSEQDTLDEYQRKRGVTPRVKPARSTGYE